MTQSQFEKESKKFIFRILTELVLAGDFDFENPYLDYDSNESKLSKVIRKYGYKIKSELDVEFFAQLKKLNNDLLQVWFQTKDKNISENLVIPECYRWDVDYKVHGSEYFVDYYSDRFNCYRKDWVYDLINQLHDNGNWYHSDGTFLERDIRDSESDTHEYLRLSKVEDSANELSEIYKKKRNQTTQLILNKLDEKSLYRLKEMIDKRLGLI